MKTAHVIGAGIGGLASAIRLSKLGYQVHVYEQSNLPGGKCTQFEMDGYRFDRGPSLFTLPEVMQELFELCGERMEDHFKVYELPVICHYFFSDGSEFKSVSNTEEQIKKMAYFFQEDERKIRDFFADSQFIYETTAPIFMQRPLAWKHLYKTSAFWKGILRLPLLPLRGTLIKQLKKYFKNKKTIQYFSRYATYNGSSPFATPAMMQLMPHVEQGIGAYLPEKGMYSISNSLMHLAIRQGAKFHFESKVTALKLNRNRVEAIQFQNEQWVNLNEQDVVISNMDVHGTYRQLIKDFPAPEKWLNQEKSSSALIFYWGMNRKFDQLDVHNIFFSDCYEDEFDHLFNKKDLAQDLTVYVHITSKLIPNDAPNSGENWFVMVNAPHVNGQNWQEQELKAREQIIKKLSQILKVEIENHICCERIWNPEGIQTDTSSYLGALYGNASNSAYSAFQRHANVNSSILGLYFAGGSVHPGGGVPLAMLSAKMIEHHILAHE